jgi:hypothetical protein
MSAAQETLVVVDGRVTDEKLAELLDLQTEQPERDCKRIISPGTTEGLVELTKDVGLWRRAQRASREFADTTARCPSTTRLQRDTAPRRPRAPCS